MPKILMIDDDTDILEVTKSLLAKKGYETVINTTWAEAQKTLETYEPQVILLDVFLDDTDGLDICKQLKSMPKTKHIPIIVMSAFPQLAEKATTCEFGAQDFLAKPFELNDLVEKLYSVLSVKAD